MALTTRAKVKLWLGIPDATTTFDARLDALLAAVESEVQNFCGREFVSAERTVVLDGRGRSRLNLPEYPVTEVESVHIDAESVFGEGTELAATEYVLNGDAGILLRRSGVWPEYPQGIRVVYTAGYATIPDDLQQWVCEIVSDRWTKSRQLESGAPQQQQTSESISGLGSSSFVNELSDASPFPKSAEQGLRSKYRARI